MSLEPIATQGFTRRTAIAGGAAMFALAATRDIRRVAALGDPGWSRRLLPGDCWLEGHRLTGIFVGLGGTDVVGTFDVESGTFQEFFPIPDLQGATATGVARLDGHWIAYGRYEFEVRGEPFQAGLPPDPLPEALKDHPMVALAGTTITPTSVVSRPWLLAVDPTRPGLATLVTDQLGASGVPIHCRVNEDRASVWIANEDAELNSVTFGRSLASFSTRTIFDRFGETGWISLIDSTVYVAWNGETAEYQTEDFANWKLSSVDTDGLFSTVVKQGPDGRSISVGIDSFEPLEQGRAAIRLSPDHATLVLNVLNSESKVVALNPRTGLRLIDVSQPYPGSER